MTFKTVPFKNFEQVEITKFYDRQWKPRIELEKRVRKKWNDAILASLKQKDPKFFKEFLDIITKNDKERYEELLPVAETVAAVFNGSVTRAIRMKQNGNKLLIECEKTDYMHHVATRTNKKLDERANTLYAAVVIVTSDGYLVFGVSEGTEGRFAGKRNLAAGLVHPVIDAIDGKPSTGLALQREMFEETGLRLEHFKRIYPSFVVSEENMQHPSIVYKGYLSLDKEKVMKHFEAKCQMDKFVGETSEFSSLEFVKFDQESLKKELKNADRYHKRILIILEHLYNELQISKK